MEWLEFVFILITGDRLLLPLLLWRGGDVALFISFRGDLLLLPSVDSSFLTSLFPGEGDRLRLLVSKEGNLFSFLPIGDDECFFNSISGELFLLGI